jgi:membrane fusion protein, copper/silver efflux system
VNIKKLLFTIVMLLVLVGSFLGGIWYSRRGDNTLPVAEKSVTAGPSENDTGSSAVSSVRGAVEVTPKRRQLSGVQTEVVERASKKYVLRTLGRVTTEENLTYRIIASTDGWVADVRGGTTGSLVQKDQLLASIYNYQFLTRVQQFLYALDSDDRRRKARVQSSPPQSQDGRSLSEEQSRAERSGAPQRSAVTSSYDMIPATPGDEDMSGRAVYAIRDQMEVAKLELYNLGVGDYQIQEMIRTRKPAPYVEIRSPATGTILSRNISPQQRFDRGVELFRIADLTRVWVAADVFAQETRYVRPGMKASVFLPGDNKPFQTTITDIPPQVDPVTRTFRIRLETDNPELILRPDMFVDVEFHITLPPAITVPVDALLDSGFRKSVFVDAGNGFFEPREVETGWRLGGRVEITKGLKPGERVVASGTFLVDSESRLGSAAATPSTGPAESR